MSCAARLLLVSSCFCFFSSPVLLVVLVIAVAVGVDIGCRVGVGVGVCSSVDVLSCSKAAGIRYHCLLLAAACLLL